MATVIPKQPKKERDQITIRLDREVLATLEHYCRYLDSARDYVINQCLIFIFRKDRSFAEWLASQGFSTPAASNGATAESIAPKPASRKPRSSAHQGRLAVTE